MRGVREPRFHCTLLHGFVEWWNCGLTENTILLGILGVWNFGPDEDIIPSGLSVREENCTN
jgi:hypothetical protein